MSSYIVFGIEMNQMHFKCMSSAIDGMLWSFVVIRLVPMEMQLSKLEFVVFNTSSLEQNILAPIFELICVWIIWPFYQPSFLEQSRTRILNFSTTIEQSVHCWPTRRLDLRMANFRTTRVSLPKSGQKWSSLPYCIAWVRAIDFRRDEWLPG